MNRIETALVYGVPRRAQRLHEVPLLVRLSGQIPGEVIAELDRRGLHVGEWWRTRICGDYPLGVAGRGVVRTPDGPRDV